MARDDDTVDRYLELIQLNPGITRQQLVNYSPLSLSGVQHYIDTLSVKRKVKTNTTDQIRIYPTSQPIPIFEFYHPRQKDILSVLYLHERASRLDIRTTVGHNRTVFNEHLDKLVTKGFVEIGEGSMLEATEQLMRLMKDPYNPHWVESADGRKSNLKA